MTDKTWIAAVTLGSSTDGEGKISLALYNKEGKTTHTISQPVIDGDSITTGKDTIINETAYDINGNESAVTDGNGNVTTYTYDDQNRVTGVSRKNGNETISNSISYDMGADGKTTTSVKDANGHVNKEARILETGKNRSQQPTVMTQTETRSGKPMQTAAIRHLIMTGRTA